VRGVEVFVDPATGAILGTRTGAERGRGVIRSLHILHTRLMLGPAGSFLVIWANLAAFLLVLGGMHFFNMHMLHKLGRRRPWVSAGSPPPRPVSPPGLGQTVLRGAA